MTRFDLYFANDEGTDIRLPWYDRFVRRLGLRSPLGADRDDFRAALGRYNAKLLMASEQDGHDCIEFESSDDALIFLLKWT
jgi:hypothetical protein